MDSTTISGGQNQQPRKPDSATLLMLPAPLAADRDRMSSLSRSSEDNHFTDAASGSNQRLVSSPQSGDEYAHAGYDSSSSGVPRYDSALRSAASGSSSAPFLEGSANPFYSPVTSPTSYDDPIYSPDSTESAYRVGGRGVRLTDAGPVPGPEGVRRVSRPSGRQPAAQNRYSRNSTAFNLPPGAAAPQQPYGGS